jgi:hypothetical protein
MFKWIKNLWGKISALRGKVEMILTDVDCKLDDALKAIDDNNIDKVREAINKIKTTIDIAKKIL